MPFINASMSEVPTSIPLVPPGQYTLEVLSSEVQPNSKGDGQNLIVDFKIISECESKGRDMKKWFSLKPFPNDKTGRQHLMGVKRMFLSAGFTEDDLRAMGDNIDTAALHGKAIRGVVKASTYTPAGGGAPRETTNLEDILIPGDKGYQVG